MARRSQAKQVFVALLRGVNVGGNNMINMRSLKESFETIGFSNVSTYINSGNIIFQSKQEDPRKLEKKIEQMLSSNYHLDSKVVIRSLSEMEKLVKALPESWSKDSNWRYNVIFLRHSIASEKIRAELPANSDVEEVLYCPGALLWSTQATQMNQSKVGKLLSRKIFQDITVRNLNTTRKLHDLMKKAGEP